MKIAASFIPVTDQLKEIFTILVIDELFQKSFHLTKINPRVILDYMNDDFYGNCNYQNVSNKVTNVHRAFMHANMGFPKGEKEWIEKIHNIQIDGTRI